MALVDLIDAERAPLLVAHLYENGDPGPIASALAQVPELCEVALPFLGASLGPGATGVRLKELVILRTSARLECRYCVAAHTAVALDVGLGLDEVHALRDDDDLDAAFADPRERALLAWIDAVATGRGPVPAGVTAAMRERFDDHEIVELTNCIGVTMLLNRFCTALDLPVGASVAERLTSEGFDIR